MSSSPLKRKGVILAGGSGTRFYPVTLAVTKQLLPVYDKPMIYYPLSTLMLAGIRDILIISTPREQSRFLELLGNGKHLGISLEYAVQESPAGIAQGLIIAEDFLGGSSVAYILGDNFFYGSGLIQDLQEAARAQQGATVFAYSVKNPRDYGVIELDGVGAPVSIEEKPANPRSSYAVPGLYFYDADVIRLVRTIRPSARGELEITDVNRAYLKAGQLRVSVLGRGWAWMDTGTPEALLQVSNFISAVEQRQGLKIGCIEEVAYRMGYVDIDQLSAVAKRLGSNGYADYLREIVTSESGTKDNGHPSTGRS